MKNLRKEKELLSAYIDGELSPVLKQSIEDKLKSSLELQKEFEDLKKLKTLTSGSVERLSESPYFESRLFANLKNDKPSTFNFKKWIPVSAVAVLTIGLMTLLRFNPQLIDSIIQQQKSNLVGFYKENLQPLLYAANLTNEDIFNFALYQELPLDNSKTQVLKLGYDNKGVEYFEIKKGNTNNNNSNNLKNFVAAIGLGEKETEKIDSIIGSYSDQLSSLVLVNDKNAVAISPNIWNTRKVILADILAFAKSHSNQNFNKIVPNEVANINDKSIAKWVNDSKKLKDNKYIFFTPDSVFKEDFEFDMVEFKENMKELHKELAQLEKNKVVLKKFNFKNDSVSVKQKNSENWSRQFTIVMDSNFLKVTVPDIVVDIPEISLPDFDSIASILHDATRNIPELNSRIPSVTVDKKSFNYEFRRNEQKIDKRKDFNLDSLMQQNNIYIDSIHSEQLKRFEKQSNNKGLLSLTDSLIIHQNKELKKEMDNLRKELQKFRQNMNETQSDSGSTNKKTKPKRVQIIEI